MRQYETFELAFSGTAPEGGEAQVDLDAVFTNQGTKISVKGFYAGNGTYKVRFYPEAAGLWQWKVSGVVEASGEEECVAAEGTLPLQNGKWHVGRGIVHADGLHFKYADGSSYKPFGTTIYALVHQEKALIDQTMETLKTAPFNKVRFCAFPKHYDYNHNDPEHFAFEKTDGKWDVHRPCFAYWDALEERIRELDGLGIQGDLILFHPYDCWGFAELDEEECMVYLDYLLRRLSAYPNLWWSLANEYDLMEHFELQWWYDFAKFIAENDPYHHLLSNHNCIPYWDFAEEHTTHCCIQDTCVKQVPNLQKKYGKPVVFDECCYEGDLQYPWGNISAREMTERFWTAVTLGGYCTHGEVFENEDEVLWWAKGGTLKGESPARIAFLRSIVEELPGNLEFVPGQMAAMSYGQLKEMEKNPEMLKNLPVIARGMVKMSESRFEAFIERHSETLGHCGEEAYLRYFGRECNGRGIMELPETGNYEVEVIDTWEMTRDRVKSGVSGKVEVKLPGREGMALLARKIG